MLKIRLFVLVTIWVLCGHLIAEEKKFRLPPGDRIRTNIDFGWRFFRGDVNGEEETHQVNQRPWQAVNLPHEWSIDGPFDASHNTTQGFLPMEIGWYRKGLRFPESYEDKKIYVIFDGVYRECDVWMNYALIAHHTSGYTSFAVDLTPFVRTGDTTPNGLRVRVDGRRHEQDMYEGSGIYRHVWLVVTNQLHVANWGTFVSTPEISKKQAKIKVQTKIQNACPDPQKFKLITKIVDAAGNEVAEMINNYELAAGAEQKFTQETSLKNPNLWQLNSPYLYRACSIIQIGNDVVDTYKTRFGIRSFHFDANRGFFLNGEPVKLQGFCAHYDFPALGTAIPDRIQRDAMTAMKKAGFNLFRSSHNPASAERLDYCDEIGMLVWDEIERKLESEETELPLVRDTIIRDRNHPSVILWSLENESPLESTTFGAAIIVAGTALAHELDPTRPTTFAASMPVNRNGYGEAADVVSYNYNWRRADQDHLDFPHWKIGLISEYSAKKTRRGVYGINKKFDLFGGEVNTIYQACVSVEGYWKRIRARDFLGGGCVWAGIDYWGEGVRWPLSRSGYGMIDMCFTPKDPYYYFVSQWTDEPMIHIFPHWNWAGREGQIIDVWGYSNCDEVELFLNGKSLGVQPRPIDTNPWMPVQGHDIPPEKRSYHFFEQPESADEQAEHFAWPVAYQPGTLRAVGKKNGAVVCEKSIHTSGKSARIKLTRYMSPYLKDDEMTPLVADGRDIAVIKAAILDRNEQPVPQADNVITFEIDGKEKILGTGNGDLPNHDSVKGNIYRAFNGYCAVIVQSTTTPGTFTVSATAAGLAPGQIQIQSVAADVAGISIIPQPYIPVRAGTQTQVITRLVDKFGGIVTAAEDEIKLLLDGPAVFADNQKSIRLKANQGKVVAEINYLKAGLLTIHATSENELTGRMRILIK